MFVISPDMADKEEIQETASEGDVADAIKITKIFERHEKQDKQEKDEETVLEKTEVLNVEDDDDELDFRVKSNDCYLSKNRRRGVCIILGL